MNISEWLGTHPVDSALVLVAIVLCVVGLGTWALSIRIKVDDSDQAGC